MHVKLRFKHTHPVSAMFKRKLNAFVTSFFCSYGQLVGRYPLPFVAVPLLFGMLCMASIPVFGVIHGKRTEIFLSETSKARASFEIIKSAWPNGTVIGKWNDITTSIIISAVENRSVFEPGNYMLIEQLNKRVMERSDYGKICEKDLTGACLLENVYLRALRFAKELNFAITYPVFRVGEQSPRLLTGIIGGVVTDGGRSSDEMIVIRAHSMQLYYVLNTSLDDTATQNFADIIREECMLIGKSGNLTATFITVSNFYGDFDAAGKSVGGRLTLLIGLTFIVALIVSFRIITTTTSIYVDTDQSALAITEVGLLSSLLGCSFSYGLMFWFKLPFAPLFQLIPFLAIGRSSFLYVVFLRNFTS